MRNQNVELWNRTVAGIENYNLDTLEQMIYDDANRGDTDAIQWIADQNQDID